jgi:hypothetical protein
MSHESHLIDHDRTACLCDVGQTDYLAATVVTADGSAHLILAQRDAIGDERVRFDATCSDVDHEQLGALPLETVRRITISGRMNRCGRPTKSGAPCRTPVARPGDSCTWHRVDERTHPNA